MTIKFMIFNGLTRKLGGSLDVTNWSYEELDLGLGTMKGSIEPSRFAYANFRTDEHGLALVDGDQVMWAGILRGRNWSRRSNEVSIELEEMASIFYDRVRHPNLTDYIKSDVEQTTLWSDVVTAALTGAPATGIPAFTKVIPSPTGNKHTLTFRVLQSYGKVFDNLQARVRGLQWWVSYRLSPDKRYLQLTVNVGRRGRNTNPIVAELDDSGGNIQGNDWNDSSDLNRTAIYTFGDGQAPDIPWGYDEDPGIAKGKVMRREIAVSRTGAVEKSTLNARARDERRWRGQRTTVIPVTIPADSPDYRTYSVGDRARLNIEDEWVAEYVPAAKITARTVSGQGDEADFVKLELDLADYEQPREDEATEVA